MFHSEVITSKNRDFEGPIEEYKQVQEELTVESLFKNNDRSESGNRMRESDIYSMGGHNSIRHSEIEAMSTL